MADIDAELLASLKESSAQQVSKKPEIKEAKIEKKAIAKKAGESLFSEIFGWKPTIIDDLPLHTYAEEDWDEKIRARIPALLKGYLWNREYTEKAALAIHVGGPILLHGPTGTGKTEMARQLCGKFGMPFFRVSCHQQMEMSDFLGNNMVVNNDGVPVTQHSHTDTTLAATYGGMLVVDEAFRSPILMAIQGLLETPHHLVLQDAHGANRILHPAKPLHICLTDNTNGTGDSSGVYNAEVQDVSTLDRLRHTLYVDYMPKKAEKAMLGKNFPDLDESILGDMVSVANLIRSAFKEGKIMQTMSLRALCNWADNSQYTGELRKSFQLCMLDKLSQDDQAVVNSCFRQVTGGDV